jgi:adenosine kinase
MITTSQRQQPDHRFSPSAMMQAHTIRIEADPAITLGIISPDGRDAISVCSALSQFSTAGLRVDPGKGLF